MSEPKHFVFNDENVINSYGFYINTSGIKLERFNENPVMLNNHINSTENLIGSWYDVVKENGLLKGKPKFDEESQLGKDVSGKVSRGFLKGCSMGIIPNWDSLQRLGDKLVLMESELAEVTIIPVPSNKGSIAIYSADGVILSDTQVKELTLSAEKTHLEKINFKTKDMKKIILSIPALMALGLEDQPQDGLDSGVLEQKILSLKAQLTTVTQENEQLKLAAEQEKNQRAEEAKTRVTSKVDLAISQGKFKADQKEQMIQLGLSSESALDMTIGAIPAKQNFTLGIDTSNPGSIEVKTQDDFVALSLADQLTFKENNPEQYKKLFPN
ncbi:MAG: HK97 family phage prohead protease [Bacteroidetes bacterium]|nr:HK97 family phage prohead protease [Bacteroidota bacterium]